MKSIDIKIASAARRAVAERALTARHMIATGTAQAEYVRQLIARFPDQSAPEWFVGSGLYDIFSVELD